jgi:peptide/nickel transport system substrate-binding protein
VKKVLVPLAILLVVVFVITGCGSGTPTSSIPAATTPAATTPAATTPAVTTPGATTPAGTKPAATTPAASSPVATSPLASTKNGGNFRYITASGPGAPIGAPWFANGTSTFCMQFSEQFLLKEMSDGSLQPNLASSYDVVTDPANASVTLHLQKGVKFSDGTDFNATAVKWNLDMAMNTTGSTTKGSTTNWKSIEVLDDYTIRVNLKTWQNTAVRTFADSPSYQVSPTAYQKNGADWINYNMVGTGPFLQKDFQRDQVINYTKNTNYWETGKPYLDTVQYLIVGDSLTAEALFKSGGAEVVQNYSDLMGSRLQAAGYKQVFAQVGMSTALWPDSMNADSPWSNLKVRQAAEYAIDKVGLAKAFGYGNWTASYQFNSAASPAFDSAVTNRTYDVAKAKQTLADAGYPNGLKTNIYVSPFGSNYDIAVALQAAWAVVGIKADLQFPQTGAWSAMLTGTWRNGVLFGPGPLSANPNSGWTSLAPGSAWYQSLKKPDGWADLYTASIQATKLDPVLAKKCEDALFNDVTNIPLFNNFTTWSVLPSVQDSGFGTRGIFAWLEPQNLWLSK